jgi:hypothetical protein
MRGWSTFKLMIPRARYAQDVETCEIPRGTVLLVYAIRVGLSQAEAVGKCLSCGLK